MSGPVHQQNPDQKRNQQGKERKKKPSQPEKEYAPRLTTVEEQKEHTPPEAKTNGNSMGEFIQSQRKWNPRNFIQDPGIVGGYKIDGKKPKDKIEVQAKGPRSLAYLLDRFGLTEEDLRPKSMADADDPDEEDED